MFRFFYSFFNIQGIVFMRVLLGRNNLIYFKNFKNIEVNYLSFRFTMLRISADAWQDNSLIAALKKRLSII